MSGGDTSRAAGVGLDVAGLEDLWVATIGQYATPGDGLTAAEVAEVTGLPINTVSPRTAPLVRAGRIFDTTLRRENPATGRKQIVWAVR